MLSRRSLIRASTAVAAAAVCSAQDATSGKTAIHQEVDYNVPPQRIYEALLDAKQFTAFTEEPAEINREVGGAFSTFSGQIVGRNIELAPNQRIVQAWRVSAWPAGVYSLVKFEITAQGAGARVILDHSGFTSETWAGLNSGWPVRYWEPLRKYFSR
jgi:activator of HSP90 ATPase